MKFAECSSAAPLGSRSPTGARLSFGIAAGGALIATYGALAAPAHAQIYNSNLTASAANASVYFSTTTGASSYGNFAAATDQLNYVSATGNASIAPIGSGNNIAVYDCYASRFTAGSSIQNGIQTDSSNNNSMGASTYGNGTYDLSSNLSWAYPGSGYLGFRQDVTVGTVTNSYYGWASVNLFTDHTARLNSFALQTAPGTDILAGAAPIAAAATPEPDAVALLALGASGLAAFRLRRKVQSHVTQGTNRAPLAD